MYVKTYFVPQHRVIDFSCVGTCMYVAHVLPHHTIPSRFRCISYEPPIDIIIIIIYHDLGPLPSTTGMRLRNRSPPRSGITLPWSRDFLSSYQSYTIKYRTSETGPIRLDTQNEHACAAFEWHVCDRRYISPSVFISFSKSRSRRAFWDGNVPVALGNK